MQKKKKKWQAHSCNQFDDKWYVYQQQQKKILVISKEKDMLRKIKYIKTKMTSFPASGIEP